MNKDNPIFANNIRGQFLREGVKIFSNVLSPESIREKAKYHFDVTIINNQNLLDVGVVNQYEVNSIGPDLVDRFIGRQSDGERSFARGNFDPNEFIICTWAQGFHRTLDGGKSWSKLDLENGKQIEQWSVGRDVVEIDKDRFAILRDSPYYESEGSVNIVDFRTGRIIDVSPHLQGFYCPQSMCIKDKYLYIGGFGNLSILRLNITDLDNPYNKQSKKVKWEKVSLEGADRIHARALATDGEGGLCTGGWITPTWTVQKSKYFANSIMPGAGVWFMEKDGKSFKRPKWSDEISCVIDHEKRKSHVNAIEVCFYKRNKIFFIGTEGSGNSNGNKPLKDFPILHIVVEKPDGSYFVYDQDKINQNELVNIAGPWGMVSPQHGIVTVGEDKTSFSNNSLGRDGLVFIGMVYGSIACAQLEQIINHKEIKWYDPTLGVVCGTMGMQKNEFADRTEITIGGATYGRGAKFQQLRKMVIPKSVYRPYDF